MANGWSPDTTTITSNTIRLDGTIQGIALIAGERLIIRNNPIAILINTSASFDPASTLQFLVNENWTSPIAFSPGLNPSLGGTLDLELADGVDPSNLLGESFHLFTWNTPLDLSNHFSAITTESGLNWDTSNLYTNGNVTLTAIPEPDTLFLIGLGLAWLLAQRSSKTQPKSI